MGRKVAVGHQNVGRLQISVSDISVVQVHNSRANVLGNFILKGKLFEGVTCVDEVKPNGANMIADGFSQKALNCTTFVLFRPCSILASLRNNRLSSSSVPRSFFITTRPPIPSPSPVSRGVATCTHGRTCVPEKMLDLFVAHAHRKKSAKNYFRVY